ncbi:MAG TPA: hypothetical protein PKW80_14255 [Bacteroidales bacterium]|nr:hypothetical protein [Bacteroidales bacterium]
MYKLTGNLIISIFVVVFFSLSSLSFSQGLSQAQKDSILNAYVTLPNSDVRIVPPAYFKAFANDGKFGFMHEGAGASISFQEISGTPYPIVVQYMSKEHLETQGVKFITKENVQTKQKKDGVMYLVSFPVKSKDGSKELQYERMMLFTGDYNRTIWISANYPVVARKMLFVPLKESLLSVQFD